MTKNSILILLLTICLISGCREVTVPKPKGYFRIDLPEKKYRLFDPATAYHPGSLPLLFEYPVYGEISFKSDDIATPGWFNINFPSYRAKIYFTYKDVRGDLAGLIEESYKLDVKNHITKADAINEELITKPEHRVYGILYDLKGSTATAVQFFVTDSTKHFFRGSLYFSSAPNPDSLAPVIDFFRKDVVHLIETLEWQDK
ncbi:MAG TPA: gliding motility lipoprotein GldD [Bacteroidales bacterium]|nr:gliding motility lipoprotein GldD [Bacteroidales bacterium]HOU01928.1 gliding motility lipoprotein GldD [Bacteroidales bacterium]HQG62577.1 gliding motility lipoprotein GldD [Bacteroidales bacterium]HQK67298.1 gliding motility lipoprotein GldD [Bacteroidales bacterium]